MPWTFSATPPTSTYSTPCRSRARSSTIAAEALLASRPQPCDVGEILRPSGRELVLQERVEAHHRHHGAAHRGRGPRAPRLVECEPGHAAQDVDATGRHPDLEDGVGPGEIPAVRSKSGAPYRPSARKTRSAFSAVGFTQMSISCYGAGENAANVRDGRFAGSPRAVARPGLPQIRTCTIRASGSSGQGFAARRYKEWTARAGGSGYRASNTWKRSHVSRDFHDRRRSHLHQVSTTTKRKREIADEFPVIP